MTTVHPDVSQANSTVGASPKGETGGRPVARRSRWVSGLRVSNIGALYVLVIEIVVFSLWAPSTFPHVATVQQILDGNAITALAALALLVPLSAGVFDLSFAYTMSLSGVTAAHFVVADHLSVAVAMVIGILVAMIIGVINGFVVVVLKVDSFIGTLGTGSLVQAFISYVTHDNPINNLKLAGTFTSVSQHVLGGVVAVVYWAVALAVVLWLFMQYTSTGRRLYASGFNPEAAKLASVRVDRLRFFSLITSSAIAGFAGVMLASSLSSGSPSAGTSYLLPAFAASFVGATQFKRDRMNAWGTVVAVLMLGTGTVGLGLVSAPLWAPQMFTGVVLLAALAASSLQHRNLIAGSALWRGGAGLVRAITGRKATTAAASPTRNP